jgi:hypothetical protein
MASAIADNLQDEGFEVDVEVASAELATVESIAEAERVDEQVIEVQQAVAGVTIEEAQSEEFEAAVESAVAAQLGVFPQDVAVTGVEVSDAGVVTVTYVVKNVQPDDLEEKKSQLESADVATAVGASLQEAGFDEVSVEAASADVSNVRIFTVTVVRTVTPIAGVTVADGESADFQAAIQAAVAKQLGSDVEEILTSSVKISSVAESDGGVVMTFDVEHVCPTHLERMRASLESQQMADVISSSLQNAGYESAEASRSSAEVTTVSAVVHYEVVAYEQVLTGVSVAEARRVALSTVRQAIAGELGRLTTRMDADDVDITSVTVTAAGAVSISYTVKYVAVADLSAAEELLMSAATADVIAASLKKAGYKKIAVMPAQRAQVAAVKGKASPLAKLATFAKTGLSKLVTAAKSAGAPRRRAQ